MEQSLTVATRETCLNFVTEMEWIQTISRGPPPSLLHVSFFLLVQFLSLIDILDTLWFYRSGFCAFHDILGRNEFLWCWREREVKCRKIQRKNVLLMVLNYRVDSRTDWSWCIVSGLSLSFLISIERKTMVFARNAQRFICTLIKSFFRNC